MRGDADGEADRIQRGVRFVSANRSWRERGSSRNSPRTALVTVVEPARPDRKAVRGLVQRDAIPHRKVGKGLRFDRAEVEAWSQPTGVRPRPVHAVNVVRGRRKAGDGSLTAELKALGYR